MKTITLLNNCCNVSRTKITSTFVLDRSTNYALTIRQKTEANSTNDNCQPRRSTDRNLCRFNVSFPLLSVKNSFDDNTVDNTLFAIIQSRILSLGRYQWVGTLEITSAQHDYTINIILIPYSPCTPALGKNIIVFIILIWYS